MVGMARNVNGRLSGTSLVSAEPSSRLRISENDFRMTTSNERNMRFARLFNFVVLDLPIMLDQSKLGAGQGGWGVSFLTGPYSLMLLGGAGPLPTWPEDWGGEGSPC